MNLPLHIGLLGALEAGLIALLIGVLSYGLWHWIVRAFGGSTGHALGWAFVTAIVVGAGTDAWNLFYLGMMKLESPLYARLALQGIHDAGSVGTRVLLEITGAMVGVVIGWQLFTGGFREKNRKKGDVDVGNSD